MHRQYGIHRVNDVWQIAQHKAKTYSLDGGSVTL
jgi:hypothetical protein